MACYKTLSALYTERGDVSVEDGQSSCVETDAWGREGAELQKHRLFYFGKVVLLILCFNRGRFLHATGIF